MDYLEYFDLASEPFSNAPLSRFYYASRQHTEALERLRYAANTMKGLAILIGEIGLGKTTLARRMLESLPEEEYEAAMLVIVHAGITANWLLKRIAIQLGVPNPADDKLTILSQLYQRLVEIYQSGKRAVVLIDEAQMLATRELMEEFRGLLNLEVPERKLISFIFFGLPEIERNLRLDPPLAQRIALRYHMKPLGREDTLAYIEHRLNLAGGGGRQFFSQAALDEIYTFTKGVPRLVNTLCDNLLLEMFFTRSEAADVDMVTTVAENLGFGKDFDVSSLDAEPEPERPEDPLAVEGGPGADAVVAVDPSVDETPAPGDEDDSWDVQTPPATPIEPEAIAAQVASEPMLEADPEPDASLVVDESAPEVGPSQPQPETALPEHAPEDRGPPAEPLATGEKPTTVDIEDPLAFLEPTTPELPERPSPWEESTDEIEIQVVDDGPEDDVPEIVATEVVTDDDQLPGEADDGGFEVHVDVDEPSSDEPAPLGVPAPAPPPLPVPSPGVEVASSAPDTEVLVEPDVEPEVEPEVVVEVPEPDVAGAEPEPTSDAAPTPEPTPTPEPAPAAAVPTPTKSKVDLADVDALLADIDQTLKK